MGEKAAASAAALSPIPGRNTGFFTIEGGNGRAVLPDDLLCRKLALVTVPVKLQGAAGFDL